MMMARLAPPHHAANDKMDIVCCLYCRRSKSERSAPAYPAVDDVVVPMDALGDTYFRLANDDRVGRAVRASAQ